MKKVAVVLSGCGYLDGAEIREAVITLLELDKKGAEVSIFAPNINQHDVINHLTGETMPEKRNVLLESARIARGKIQDLKIASASSFDAIVLPGGFGAAKNLSDVASKGKDANAIPELKNLLSDFIAQQKPIGVICIAPAVLAAALKGVISAKVTIGDENDLISGLGATHQVCKTEDICFDEQNKIVSCSAYMRNDSLVKIAQGIEKLITKVIEIA